MKPTEVTDHSSMVADLINMLLNKDVEVLVCVFDHKLTSYVDAFIGMAEGDGDIIILNVGVEDKEAFDTYRHMTIEVLTDDYTLEKVHDRKWRLVRTDPAPRM